MAEFEPQLSSIHFQKENTFDAFGNLFRLGGPMSQARERHALRVAAAKRVGADLDIEDDGLRQFIPLYRVDPHVLEIGAGQVKFVSPVQPNRQLVEHLRQTLPEDLPYVLQSHRLRGDVETNLPQAFATISDIHA